MRKPKNLTEAEEFLADAQKWSDESAQMAQVKKLSVVHDLPESSTALTMDN